MISKEDYTDCLVYIRRYWPKITFYLPDERGLHIGLPNKFVSPNAVLFKNDQFYWDTYFTMLGLLASGKTDLAKGMVENFWHLWRRFKIIPMRNKLFNLGISQPPFLTSMLLEVFAVTKDTAWLAEGAKVAEEELRNYWMNLEHSVENLSRYCDHFWTHATAEHESGWDMTSRFNDRCLNYLPVDLNSCLYKYESDLAAIYRLLRNNAKAGKFAKAAEQRKQLIHQLMWNEEKGFFFDYIHTDKQQSNFYSLAGFYPLWAGLATPEQAKKMSKALKKFEYDGGLSNTQVRGLAQASYKQWDHPHGWPNQQYIVIAGLLKYGLAHDAERLAKKWLDMNKKVFQATGKFWEKYNVVTCTEANSGRYPTQTGFGWTNSIFVKLLDMFSE